MNILVMKLRNNNMCDKSGGKRRISSSLHRRRVPLASTRNSVFVISLCAQFPGSAMGLKAFNAKSMASNLEAFAADAAPFLCIIHSQGISIGEKHCHLACDESTSQVLTSYGLPHCSYRRFPPKKSLRKPLHVEANDLDENLPELLKVISRS